MNRYTNICVLCVCAYLYAAFFELINFWSNCEQQQRLPFFSAPNELALICYCSYTHCINVHIIFIIILKWKRRNDVHTKHSTYTRRITCERYYVFIMLTRRCAKRAAVIYFDSPFFIKLRAFYVYRNMYCGDKYSRYTTYTMHTLYVNLLIQHCTYYTV